MGRLLDGKFDSEPALTLVFLALGLFFGFYGAYKQLTEVLERLNRGRAGPKGR